MSGRHSEVGKEKLEPYLRGKDERCPKKKVYVSPELASQFEKSGGVALRVNHA